MIKKKTKLPGRRAIFLILSLLAATFLGAQVKEPPVLEKAFSIPHSQMLEKVMVSLEDNDIFIVALDLKKGTVVSEYKTLSAKGTKAYTGMDLVGADFDLFRYRVETRVKRVNGQSLVEVGVVLKAYGRRFKHQGARPHWYTLPSNGKLELEILEMIR